MQTLSIQQYDVLAFLKIIWYIPSTLQNTKSLLSVFPSLHHIFTWRVPQFETSPFTKGGIHYYLFSGSHNWRILWSSYRRLAWLGWLKFFLFIEQKQVLYIYIYISISISISIYISIYIYIYIHMYIYIYIYIS